MHHPTQPADNAPDGPRIKKVSDLPPTVPSNRTAAILRAIGHFQRRPRRTRARYARRHNTHVRRDPKGFTRRDLLTGIGAAAAALALPRCLNLPNTRPPALQEDQLMGTPVPTPPEIGDHCEECDDILWPTGRTRRWMRANVINIFMCPGSPAPMPRGLYVLEQDSLYPCQYYGIYEPWGFFSRFYATRTLFYIQYRDWPMQYAFFHYGDNNHCEMTFTNDFTECGDPAIGTGGNVTCVFI